MSTPVRFGQPVKPLGPSPIWVGTVQPLPCALLASIGGIYCSLGLGTRDAAERLDCSQLNTPAFDFSLTH